MKIKTRSKKPLIIATVIAGLLLISGVVYAIYTQQSQDHNVSDSSDTSQIKESEGASKDAPTSELPPKGSINTNEPETDASDNSSDTPPAAIEVPKIERASQSGDTVKVVASFQKASQGKCEARFQRASGVVKRTTGIVLGPAYYSCSFSIPTAEFPSSGSWSLSLSHLSGTSVSTAPIQTLSVQRQ